MANIPWAKIKAEWLKGGITQKELAEKYIYRNSEEAREDAA